MFNALDSLGVVDGARVLDLFAGSGSLGTEALSRGAVHVVFADIDRAARMAVARNLDAVGAGDRADVRAAPAERVVADAAAAQQRFDLVLLDPPYAFDGWTDLLAAVIPVLADDAVVVIESDRPVPLATMPLGAEPPSSSPGPTDVEAGSSPPPERHLTITRQKRYGSTVVTFARPSGAGS